MIGLELSDSYPRRRSRIIQIVAVKVHRFDKLVR